MKKIAKLLLLFLCIICLFGCNKNQQDNMVYVNYEKSSFNDFYIEDENVYFKCTIFISNTHSTSKLFHISADFEDDFNNGLICEENLTGRSLDGSADFVLDANQSESFEVIFVGKYAHKSEQKEDRLLPNVTCEVI